MTYVKRRDSSGSWLSKEVSKRSRPSLRSYNGSQHYSITTGEVELGRRRGGGKKESKTVSEDKRREAGDGKRKIRESWAVGGRRGRRGKSQDGAGGYDVHLEGCCRLRLGSSEQVDLLGTCLVYIIYSRRWPMGDGLWRETGPGHGRLSTTDMKPWPADLMYRGTLRVYFCRPRQFCLQNYKI